MTDASTTSDSPMLVGVDLAQLGQMMQAAYPQIQDDMPSLTIQYVNETYDQLDPGDDEISDSAGQRMFRDSAATQQLCTLVGQANSKWRCVRRKRGLHGVISMCIYTPQVYIYIYMLWWCTRSSGCEQSISTAPVGLVSRKLSRPLQTFPHKQGQ